MNINHHDSFNAHDSEYKSLYSYEFCLNQQKAFKEARIEYDADKPIGKLLDDNKLMKPIKVGIDIGCGHGYFSSLMASKLDKVIAIEPSESGIDMAKRLYVQDKNIEWIIGFAEEKLNNLELSGPALFHTSTVLSHLDDEIVSNICTTINDIAIANSLLSFSELWGFEHHEHLWHCRPASWWKALFPGWKFNFIENNVQVPYRYKSFTAVKE